MVENLTEIAWNGVCFRAPARWEIGRIGLRYLLLETLDGPQMEIKWAPVKGKLMPERQLKKLAGMQQRQVRKSFELCRLPEEWQALSQRFRTTGFLWEGPDLRGRGLLLFCPHCRTATLIQFYTRGGDRPDPAAARMLASFKDHGHSRLAVFDIQAELPRGFALQSYRFNPGQYELSFRDKHHTAVLYRWSPAAVLLRNQTLVEFTSARFDMKRYDILKSDDATVEGGLRRTPSIGRRLWNRLHKAPHFRWTRIWHENGKNRLLGVDVSGRHRVDQRTFADLCNRYVSL
jgi:hypothetical protein